MIDNVAPTVTPVADQTIELGQPLSIDLATFTDPGFDNPSAETVEQFTATVDWGDGSPLESAVVAHLSGGPGQPTTGSVNSTHVYAAPGVYLITVSVEDDDGGSHSTTLTVTVEDPNVPPTIETVSDLSGSEGDRLTFTATFTDSGDLAGHQALIDWGNGSSSAGVITVTGETATVTAEHVYADDGSYTIQIVVIDPEQLSATATATATIGNIAPILTMVADRSVYAGTPVTPLLATFTDPGCTSAAGTAETFTTTIDWGDGSPVDTAVVSVVQGADGVLTVGQISGTHTYQSLGTFTVTVTLQDDHLGAVSGTVVLTTAAKFFVVNQSDHSSYQYDPELELLARRDLDQYNSAPRGVDTSPNGDTIWVVDSSRMCSSITRTARCVALGSRTMPCSRRASQPMGRTSGSSALLRTGSITTRTLLSGTHVATQVYSLAANKASGVVTDGATLWVTDEESSNPRMFVYGLDGTVLGSWSLDPQNSTPTGVALDPRTGETCGSPTGTTVRSITTPGRQRSTRAARPPREPFSSTSPPPIRKESPIR